MNDTIGNFLQSNGGTIGNLLSTGSQLYGQQNAGEAISKAANAGIGVAGATMGNISSLWQPQQSLGVGADVALGKTLGTNGQPADYSNFLNMPGYQFAVEQGTQAINRAATANGSIYTPNTMIDVGKYVTGTAMQDYNTYVNQLYQAAGLGNQANTALTDAGLRTAGNIEQLGMNSGMAQAGMYAGMGQTLGGGGNFMGGPGGYGGPNSSGVGNLVGQGLKAIGGWLNGSNNSGGNANNGGVPGMTYDQSSGGYYDPQSNTYYMPNESGTGYDSYPGSSSDAGGSGPP